MGRVRARHERSKGGTWSNGLRDRYAIEPEAEPEEILAETATSELRFTIPAAQWDRIQRDPVHLALILEAVEADRFTHAHRLSHATWHGNLLCDPDTWEVIHDEPERLQRS